MTKKIIILVFIATAFADSVFAQTLKERLILTDTKDSIYLNAKWTSFDRAGNYCFEVKVNDSEYFYTNTDTIGGFKFIGSTFGNGGDIAYTHQYGDKEDKPWYFKNANGTKIYGQVRGKKNDIWTVIQTKTWQSLLHTKIPFTITPTTNSFRKFKLIKRINLE